jgi:hypothetical protein
MQATHVALMRTPGVHTPGVRVPALAAEAAVGVVTCGVCGGPAGASGWRRAARLGTSAWRMRTRSCGMTLPRSERALVCQGPGTQGW